MVTNNKPLGIKSYGSIPHLPNSRLGEGEHCVPVGQAIIVTQKKRDKNDFIIVQEKLDGSNVGIAKINNEIVPLTRSGYVANTSKHEQHKMFYRWVMDNYMRFYNVLNEGERICGEWLAQAHGTEYDLKHEPFVAFDIMIKDKRLLFNEVFNRLNGRFTMPSILSLGEPLSVDVAMSILGDYGFHGATDKVEGAVWRLERKGEVEFLCKFVRQDKEDGKYLESVTGKEPVWNEFVSCVNPVVEEKQ